MTTSRDLTEVAADAVIRLRLDGRISDCDPTAEWMLGCPREQALGMDLAEMIVEAAQRPAFRAALEAFEGSFEAFEGSFEDGDLARGRRFEITGERSDGLVFPLEVAFVPSPGASGVEVICLLRDLSLRREEEERLARSESLLAEAEAVGGFGSFELDLHTGSFDCSDGLLKLLDAGEWLNLHRFLSAFPPQARSALEGVIGRARRHGDPFQLELRLVDPGAGSAAGERPAGPAAGERGVSASAGERGVSASAGERRARCLRARGRVIRGPGHEPARLVGTLQDVTDVMEARNMREFLGYVVDSSHDAIYTGSADGRITSWNRGAEDLFGFSAEEAVGRSAELMVPAAQLAAHTEMLRAVMAGQAVSAVEVERVRRDGTPIAISLGLSPVRDGTGSVVAVAAIAHDISERKRYEQRLRHMADHDPLTDLFNRRRFAQELEADIERARRYGTAGAVLILDLDNLKTMNDSLGHAAGDALIIATGQVLARHSRASDVVARLGGDEFGVLLRAADLHQAQTAAQNLLDALGAEPLVIEGRPQRISASVGVAQFGSDVLGSDAVLAVADAALYDAKRGGRDRIVVLPASGAPPAGRYAAELEPAIRSALADGSFVVHFQPIVDLQTGAVSHSELLLRLRAGDGTLIPPAAFLPAAARAGLLPELDAWVIGEAVRTLGGLREDQRKPIAVNLSPASFEKGPELSGLLAGLLERNPVAPGLLIFDINEAAAIANSTAVGTLGKLLHDQGCALALDDFGSGFASLRHIRDLPFDFVKLDPEFIKDLAQSASAQSVVRAIVELAQGLGIKTVAESVPDSLTVQLLRQEGVDYGQGFHLGRPHPPPAPGEATAAPGGRSQALTSGSAGLPRSDPQL